MLFEKKRTADLPTPVGPAMTITNGRFLPLLWLMEENGRFVDMSKKRLRIKNGRQNIKQLLINSKMIFQFMSIFSPWITFIDSNDTKHAFWYQFKNK